MPRSPIEAYPDRSVLDLAAPIMRQSMATLGDSWLAQGWSTVADNFNSLNLEGWVPWANALAGAPLAYVANFAVGGKTIQQTIDEQLPEFRRLRLGVAIISAGHNDIYNEGVTGAVAFARMQRLVSEIFEDGSMPVWSTIFARPFGTSATLREHLRFNDLARRWAYLDDVGLFVDLHKITALNTSTNGAEVAGYYHADGGAPYIHPNNVGAYRIGKKVAAQWQKVFVDKPTGISGAEDNTNTSNDSNLLPNVIFAGSGGTAGTGVTGTVPASWTVDWSTRTGSGSAAVAVVDVTDPDDAGHATARALQLTFSGVPAAGDECRIGVLTGFNSQLTAGDLMDCEFTSDLVTPTAVDQVRSMIQANTNEATWWGNSTKTKGTLPEGWIGARHVTRQIAVLGSGAAAAAVAQIRIRFNGNGAGTVFRVYEPRARRTR